MSIRGCCPNEARRFTSDTGFAEAYIEQAVNGIAGDKAVRVSNTTHVKSSSSTAEWIVGLVKLERDLTGVSTYYAVHSMAPLLLQRRFPETIMEAQIIEKKPCNCGAMLLHLRVSDKEYWRCERGIATCGAIGKTYEDALQTQLMLFQNAGGSRVLH